MKSCDRKIAVFNGYQDRKDLLIQLNKIIYTHYKLCILIRKLSIGTSVGSFVNRFTSIEPGIRIPHQLYTDSRPFILRMNCLSGQGDSGTMLDLSNILCTRLGASCRSRTVYINYHSKTKHEGRHACPCDDEEDVHVHLHVRPEKYIRVYILVDLEQQGTCAEQSRSARQPTKGANLNYSIKTCTTNTRGRDLFVVYFPAER